MVALVAGLGAAVLYEHFQTATDCFQPSISAYYYTPARNVFVGALVGVAVCLICLRGNNDLEDLFLDFAGMFALIVAFVPTPMSNPTSYPCMSVKFAANHVTGSVANDASVANNVTALLVVGGVVLAIVTIRTLLTGNCTKRTARIGARVAIVVWAIAALGFWGDRSFFLAHAHYYAAIPMFLCIMVAAWANAVRYRDRSNGSSLKNRYSVIAVAMPVLTLGIYAVARIADWHYWLILVETVLICLFALFWLIQTRELWRRRLDRPDHLSPPP